MNSLKLLNRQNFKSSFLILKQTNATLFGHVSNRSHIIIDKNSYPKRNKQPCLISERSFADKIPKSFYKMNKLKELDDTYINSLYKENKHISSIKYQEYSDLMHLIHSVLSSRNTTVNFLVMEINNFLINENRILDKNSWSIFFDYFKLMDNKEFMSTYFNASDSSLEMLNEFKKKMDFIILHSLRTSPNNKSEKHLELSIKNFESFIDFKFNKWTSNDIEDDILIIILGNYCKCFEYELKKSRKPFDVLYNEASSSSFAKNYKNFNFFLQLLMTKNKDLEKTNQQVLSALYKSFCYHREYFINLQQNLKSILESNTNNFDIYELTEFAYAAVRFGCIDFLNILIEKQNIFKRDENFYLNFIYNSERNFASFDEALIYLLKMMNTFNYALTQNLQKEFFNWIELENSKHSNTNVKWKLQKVSVNRDGVCSNGSKLEWATYKRDDLVRIAEQLKSLNISNDPVYTLTYQRLDELLEKNSFKVVIDGLNLIYTQKRRAPCDEFNNLKSTFSILFNSMNPHFKSNKALVIFRHHIQDTYIEVLNELKEKYSNLFEIFFTQDNIKDDFIIIYSALMSHNCYIISRDFMLNHVNELLNYGSYDFDLYQNWIYNHRLSFIQNQLIPPNLYRPYVQTTKDNKWLIPYLKRNESLGCYNKPTNFAILEKVNK